MTPRSRSALTLATLTVLLVAGAGLGWNALTAPLPEKEKLPVCIETSVAAGEVVFPDQVTVSVYNGSRTNGLAHRTMASLTERGFHRGADGNSPKKVKKGVRIWADNPKDPGVSLVASQFKNAKVVPGDKLGHGVVVVVGDNATLRSATKSPVSVTAESDGRICTPPTHPSLSAQ